MWSKCFLRKGPVVQHFSQINLLWDNSRLQLYRSKLISQGLQRLNHISEVDGWKHLWLRANQIWKLKQRASTIRESINWVIWVIKSCMTVVKTAADIANDLATPNRLRME